VPVAGADGHQFEERRKQMAIKKAKKTTRHKKLGKSKKLERTRPLGISVKGGSGH
jgi:hypothetical protein